MSTTKHKTVCATCYHAPSNARYKAWYEWLCQAPAVKLDPWFNPVTGQTVADPPSLKCANRNSGDCADFQQAENLMGLKFKQTQSGA